MLKSFVQSKVKKTSVLRKLLFAVATLPSDLPNLWEVAITFATKNEECSIAGSEIKVLMENLHELDAAAFATDESLLWELMQFQVPRYKPLGLILISSNERCLLCKEKLILRKDRPAPVVIYDDQMGSIPGSHYHKYCPNRLCGLKQYYGYYTKGDPTEVHYNADWESLTYFVSSRESVFSMKLLQRFNAEIVFGQLSFKQCADVYNFLHKYDRQRSISK